MKRIITWLANIGSSQTDNEEIKLQKSLLIICAVPFMFAGAIWGIMYVCFGEIFTAWIPLAYAFFSLISLIYFSFSRNFAVFRFTQLLLILLLPCVLMVSLGGFVEGSAVILWGLLSPLGAMLLDKFSNGIRWLFAYLLLVTISTAVQPFLNLHSVFTPVQINLFFFLNLLGVGSLIFMMVSYFVGKKNYYQQRSEALLLNILPDEIATELKTKSKVEAKYYDQVTVMFTDFKNFTQIAEALSPAALVSEIDTCFKAFDEIITEHHLEKIKTIGDSYMCAGGLPAANTTHAEDAVRAALKILGFIHNYSDERVSNGLKPFEIRIGIHTGPVVAGVVGLKKFAYDIWGDTVNIASRMESSGEAGKINISSSTYALVKEKFTCTYREKIEAKNKGKIDMYFVEDAIPELPDERSKNKK